MDFVVSEQNPMELAGGSLCVSTMHFFSSSKIDLAEESGDSIKSSTSIPTEMSSLQNITPSAESFLVDTSVDSPIMTEKQRLCRVSVKLSS